jgi:hypothetical protein
VILAAGLLVLLGLGFFLAGVLTGTTAFYWVCVAVCVLAAVLLFGARRRIAQAEAALTRTAPATSRSATSASATRTSAPEARPGDGALSGATAAGVTPTDPPAAAEAEPSDAEPTMPVAAHARPEPGAASAAPSSADPKDPPVEDVEVTDLLLVVDLKDEVLVVDEHPRYHLPGCRFLVGRTAIPLPLDEARVDGFSPCALCTPDRHLADRERARKHSGGV